MKVETEKLVKVSTYAKNENKSVTWIYKLAEDKKINIVEIDGVKFVEPK
tara:strand:+ start:1441 stop:1587 length:147 start_codon:yes stop_codon:yes gene_type:complete